MIRPRCETDITALCELVREVHLSDGYPVFLQDNVEDFVVTTNCLAAWVFETNGRIEGHIALHTIWSDEVAELASISVGRSREALVSISRLFVAVGARGRGIGESLMNAAVNEARISGLWPVLDVVTTYAPAIALYERLGWTRIGTFAFPMPNGETIDEHVYAAPRLN